MANSPNASKKRRRQPFSSHEKEMIHNLYDTFVREAPAASHNEITKTVASSLGIHWISVYKIVKEKRDNNNVLKSPKKKRQRKTVVNTTDSFTQNALRRIMHEFFSRNEIPTLNKILEVVNNDTTLENYKRSTLHKLLRYIGFKFEKRSRNSIMNDRQDLQYWRRNYIKCVKEAREAGKKIFYLDETWVNEGHTKSSIWLDSTIQNARHAMINGLSSGLKNPSGKGKRLIVAHIGSEDGFVEGGLLMFESKKQGDYHQDMNAEVFEEWFTKVLDKIPEDSVIVLDNAPYHSRKFSAVESVDRFIINLENDSSGTETE